MTTTSATTSVTEPESPGGIIDPGVSRELRLAVTMNGGVSLAVYIGGAAHEFNRFTRCCSGYGSLLKLFGYDERPPIIDVITGTSAGGINAAALAVAQANSNGDLALLKGLWIQHGQIGDLMRGPFHSGPASLLKGDDYFYPQIRSAFKRLTENYDRATRPDSGPERVRPVDLTIPATLLTSVETFSVDDLGTQMKQPQHAGLFYFRGGTSVPVSDNGPDDMFSADRAKDDDGQKRVIDRTVEALALAARASAGFPAAFEPTFIPVRYNGKTPDDRPDMADYADWGLSAGKAPNDRNDLSRFAVDGGVLANTPTRPALAAIRRQEVTTTMVRRVLILVHPHAEYAPVVKNLADDIEKPPTLLSGLTGVLRASGSVGSRTYVEEIQQHNDLALRWRDGREAAMSQFNTKTLSEFLCSDEGIPQPAWQLFRHMRVRRGAYVSALHVRPVFATPFAKLIGYATEVLREADKQDGGLSFLPATPPRKEDFQKDEWRWGLGLAVGIASQTTDVLRQLINAANRIPESSRDEVVKLAHEAWEEAVNGGIKLDRLAEEERKCESSAAETSDNGANESETIRARFEKNLADYGKQMSPPSRDDSSEPVLPVPPDESTDSVLSKMMSWVSSTDSGAPPQSSAATEELPRGTRTIQILRGIVGKFRPVIEALDRSLADDERGDVRGVGGAAGSGLRDESASLLRCDNPLRGVGGDDNELLKRMLEIEIVSYLTAEHDVSDAMVPTAPIEFVQLSANITQHFADGFTSDDKLAGMSLNRFGAFLKRSWRANDWIWGRLDAVKILMLILLTPEMIRGFSAGNRSAEQVVEEIAEAAFHDDADPHRYGELTSQGGDLEKLHRLAVDDVKHALAGGDAPMTNLASLVAYGIQIGVAKEDVPWLAGTIRDDREDGATGVQTAEFLNQFDQLENSAHGHKLLRLFTDSRIGKEAVADQMPSDLMIRTAAAAAAAAVTAISSEKSGLTFARPVTKVARGMIALPYWVLIGLASRGQIARAVATVLLALGVSLTALSLITDLPGLMSKLVPTVGIASLLTVLVYAAMRTQSIVHGAALLGLFIPLIAYAVDRVPKDENANVIGETTVALVCLLVLLIWVIVVANFAPHTRSPVGTALRAWEIAKTFVVVKWRILGTILLVVMAAVLTIVFRGDFLADRYEGSRLAEFVSTLRREFISGPWNGDVQSWMSILLIAAVLAGCITAWRKSKRFRPSRSSGMPHRARLGDPAGLATAWSPVYGFIYIAIGVFLVPLFGVFGVEARLWVKVASVVSLALGLFFALIAVNLIPYVRERRLVKSLAAHFESNAHFKPNPAQDNEPEETIKAFKSIGEFSSYLTDSDSALSRHGRRVERRARRAVEHRAGGRKAVPTDRRGAAAATVTAI
jgi:patatin-related protein